MFNRHCSLYSYKYIQYSCIQYSYYDTVYKYIECRMLMYSRTRTSLKLDITNLSAGMTPGSRCWSIVPRGVRPGADVAGASDAAGGLGVWARRAARERRTRKSASARSGARSRRPPSRCTPSRSLRSSSRSRRRVLVVRLFLPVALLLERRLVRELLVRRRCLLEALQRLRQYYLLLALC